MKLLPLSPLRFHILLALSASPAHARLIATRVVYDTLGELEPSPATLHDNLRLLLRRGWLRADGERQYVITEAGREALASDLYRWRIVTARAGDALRQQI